MSMKIFKHDLESRVLPRAKEISAAIKKLFGKDLSNFFKMILIKANWIKHIADWMVREQ